MKKNALKGEKRDQTRLTTAKRLLLCIEKCAIIWPLANAEYIDLTRVSRFPPRKEVADSLVKDVAKQ